MNKEIGNARLWEKSENAPAADDYCPTRRGQDHLRNTDDSNKPNNK